MLTGMTFTKVNGCSAAGRARLRELGLEIRKPLKWFGGGGVRPPAAFVTPPDRGAWVGDYAADAVGRRLLCSEKPSTERGECS